jgi:hypothetical protein
MSLFGKLKPKAKGKDPGQNDPTAPVQVSPASQLPQKENDPGFPEKQTDAMSLPQRIYRIIGDGDRILAPGEAAPRVVYSKSQPQPAAFKTMNVSLEVWRPGYGNMKTDEFHYGALSNCLRGRNEPWLKPPNPNLAQDYLLVRFYAFFEYIINTKFPEYPVRIEHGRLRYQYQGDPREVTDQDSFEVALNDLMRGVQEGVDDYFRFTLQTETREAAISRRVDSLLVSTSDTRSVLSRPISVNAQDAAIEQEPHEQPLTYDGKHTSISPFAGQPSIFPPQPQIRRDRSVSFGQIAIPPPRSLSPTRRPTSAHGKLPTGNTINRALHQAVNVIARRPPSTEPVPSPRQSRPPSISLSSPKKLTSAFKKVSQRVSKIHESKEEERKRFAGLFAEESRTEYRKGEADDSEIELRKAAETDKEIAEEEAELPEEKKKDEEEDDISQEGRVAAR